MTIKIKDSSVALNKSKTWFKNVSVYLYLPKISIRKEFKCNDYENIDFLELSFPTVFEISASSEYKKQPKPNWDGSFIIFGFGFRFYIDYSKFPSRTTKNPIVGKHAVSTKR